ncbi:MAG TPA: hypothetical protein VGF59_20200, partial [Bryobacteraceae bacterium]
MRIAAIVCLLGAPLLAQPLPVGKPVETNFKNLKPEDLIIKMPHIHTVFADCKNAPNHVFSREGDTYYACLNGKEVCSKEKDVVIPSGLISDYQARQKAAEAQLAESRAMGERIRKDIREAFAKNGMTMPEDRSPANARTFRTVARADARPASRTGVISRPGAALVPTKTMRPVADELVRDIAVGASQADVQRKLGEPYMKMMGEIESDTWLLVSGNTADCEFAGGKLTQ